MPEGPRRRRAFELTIGACARIAGTHRDQIDAAMKSGELPYTRDGDNRRVTTKAAAALLNNCKDADADAILQDDDRPWTVVILPDKGNDPGVRYGQYEERQSVIIAV